MEKAFNYQDTQFKTGQKVAARFTGFVATIQLLRTNPNLCQHSQRTADGYKIRNTMTSKRNSILPENSA